MVLAQLFLPSHATEVSVQWVVKLFNRPLCEQLLISLHCMLLAVFWFYVRSSVI